MIVAIAALIGGYFISTSKISEQTPELVVENTGAMEKCLAHAILTMKPERVDFGFFGTMTTLCYSQLYSQALLQDFQHRRMKFIQQTYDERVLLWMVVAITISGVGLAGIQLLTSYRLAQSKAPGDETSSEFVLQRDKVVLKSSVTGLFVLLLSFCFFYVFVLEIFVIKEIKIEEKHKQAQENSQIDTGILAPSKTATPAAPN